MLLASLLQLPPRLPRLEPPEAVAMDMGKAYIKAVKENLPEVPIVFDHFHVIKLYNEKLTKLRRDLQSNAEKADKNVLKPKLIS